MCFFRAYRVWTPCTLFSLEQISISNYNRNLIISSWKLYNFGHTMYLFSSNPALRSSVSITNCWFGFSRSENWSQIAMCRQHIFYGKIGLFTSWKIQKLVNYRTVLYLTAYLFNNSQKSTQLHTLSTAQRFWDILNGFCLKPYFQLCKRKEKLSPTFWRFFCFILIY